MGLCKCPKRRVTNQFCFEHHVNVCENCMVTNHAKCVVQSYIQWLQDSDYSAGCPLCNSELVDEDCIRLTCYHVFHWSCLNSLANSLPPNVAPAGYTCPQCTTCVFPLSNLVSPVADILRGKLASVNWGRAGLGLPLLADKRDPPDGCKVTVDFDADAKPMLNNSMMRNQTHKPVVHSVESGKEHEYNNFYGASQSRRPANRPSPIGRHLSDSDDDKYKRRSPREVLSRFITRAACVSPVRVMKKQRLITAFVIVLVFIFVILLMREMSHGVTDNDPSFNLENEPNIKVGV